MNVKNWRKNGLVMTVLLLITLWRYEAYRSEKETMRADDCERRSAQVYETYRIQDSTKAEILRKQDSAKYDKLFDIATQNSYNRIIKPKIDCLQNL